MPVRLRPCGEFPRRAPGGHAAVPRPWRRSGGALLIAALAAAAAPGARAQDRVRRVVVPEAFTVIPRNDLAFGTLTRGFVTSISPHDQHHAAVFELRGPPDTPVRVEIMLPSGLAAPAGPMIPLLFGPGDGFMTVSDAWPPSGMVFNPRAPIIAQIGAGGRLYLRIGGTATPDRLQPGGSYRGEIFLTMYNLGS